jgi:hypothetical protein
VDLELKESPMTGKRIAATVLIVLLGWTASVFAPRGSLVSPTRASNSR